VAALVEGSPSTVRDQVSRATRETGGGGLLLAPGCSVPPEAPEANLAALSTA
jgi:uroporphyrinogen-III decarboxylase